MKWLSEKNISGHEEAEDESFICTRFDTGVHKKIRRMKKIFEKVLDEGLKMGFLSAYTVEGETTSPAAP